ncbi:hypothetical protein NMG60_11009403 [Bertholletia excelsa]
MELVAITATLCVTFSLHISLFLWLCLCLCLSRCFIDLSNLRLCAAYGLQSSALTLPRKLGLVEAAPPVRLHLLLHVTSYIKHHPRGGGEGGTKAPGRRGTRQEWVEEGPDASLFFTMDYSKVRRRRPIHNKSIPVGP